MFSHRARAFATWYSLIHTFRKQGINVFEALKEIFDGTTSKSTFPNWSKINFKLFKIIPAEFLAAWAPRPKPEGKAFLLRSCLNLILRFSYGCFSATLCCQNPHLALLNSGFGALIGEKTTHNKFPKPNSNSF